MGDRDWSDDTYLLLTSIGHYLKNGIPTDERSIPFTELDFYSISNSSPRELYHYLRNMPSREKVPYYKDLLKYLKQFPEPVTSRIVDRQYYKGRPLLLVVRGGVTVPVRFDDFDRVFSILEEKNIPTTKSNVMTAVTRQALQEDIFPILGLENSDKKVEKAPVFGNPYVKKINNVRKSV